MIEAFTRGLEFDITPEDFKYMPPQEKKRHIRTLIKKILQKNPNGITASQVKEIIDYDSRTISKHLEYLCAIREAYSQDFGRFNIFYPNGKVLHSHNLNHAIGNKHYSFSIVKNQFGEFIYIQEKTKDANNTFQVKGGLVVQKEHLFEFIEKLQDTILEIDNTGGS